MAIDLDIRLQHWAAWLISFEMNQHGWPKESPIAKYQREGFLVNDNLNKKSTIPYEENKRAEDVNNAFNQLKQECILKAEAVYVYYVTNKNIKKYSEEINIHKDTFYKRLREAKRWMSERINFDL